MIRARIPSPLFIIRRSKLDGVVPAATRNLPQFGGAQSLSPRAERANMARAQFSQVKKKAPIQLLLSAGLYKKRNITRTYAYI